ncbi:MAG: ABC transporter transmembrane domain-containing protein [Oligoflexia bacterium]|nr:ABC transporter transmembrane domain-containing protein [Oligoflexia bacterium]
MWTFISRRILFSDAKEIINKAKRKPLEGIDLPTPPNILRPRYLPYDDQSIDYSSPKNLILSLAKQNRKLVLWGFSMNIAYVLLSLTKPVLINRFIAVLSNGIQSTEEIQTAVTFAIAFGLVSVGGSLFLQQYFYRMLNCLQIFVNTLNRMIYKHSLRLDLGVRGKTPLGDIVNHLASDSEALGDSGIIFGEVAASVLTLVGCSVLLFVYFGWTALVSIFLLAILVPLTRKVAASFSNLDDILMKHRDKRVTLMAQILNGIRVVKYFSWEKSVASEVQNVRKDELNARKKLAVAETFATLIFVSVSTIVLFATLLVHVARGYPLSAELIFTAVSIFTLLEQPFGHLSQQISRVAAAFIGAKRISNYLKKEASNKAIHENDFDLDSCGVELNNVSTGFEGESFSLSELSIKILPGSSTAIIGPVGSGKSTLLLSLLRELPLRSGSLSFVNAYQKTINPKIAYVPQEAFIMNGSLLDNICFGETHSDELVENSTKASCLQKDLSQLPAGLYTEIGEKGVNLSGGQKQRVSLARAIYYQPTLAILDDPLSAVDPNTELSLVDNLLFGEWKNITRIIATHRLSHLNRFDQIIFLDQGKIIDQGSYQELLRNDRFREFLNITLATEGDGKLASEKESSENSTAMKQKEGSSLTETRITDDEDRAYGAVKGRIFKNYMIALGGSNSRWPLIVLALFASTLLASALPILQTYWLSAVSSSGTSTNIVIDWLKTMVTDNYQAIFVYGFLGLLTIAGILSNRLFWLNRGLIAGRDMHNGMLKSVLGSPLRFFDATPVGRLIQRFSRDVEEVDIHIQWSFETTVYLAINILTSILLIVGILPLLLLVVIPTMLLYYYLQSNYRIPAREAKRLDSIARSPRYAHFKETLLGLPVIRAYEKNGFFLEGFLDRLDQSQKMFFGHYLLNRWFSSRIPLLGALISTGTALGLVYYTYQGKISAGVAGLLMIYALTLWESLNWAVRVFAELEAKLTSVERIRVYSTLEQEKSVIEKPLVVPENWPQKGEVVFENVIARYASHLPPVLKGVSIHIQGGQKVGVIGRTGSGKSTLMQTIFRTLEIESGEIRIDGLAIQQIPLSTLRRALAIIPQDPVLFLGSLRNNLDRYAEYSDAEIWSALEKAKMAEYVKNLPNGIQSMVQESGSNFSQGQRQLLCLARALLIDAKIIILDEATASVDVKTDSLVQEILRNACQDKTVLVIAHRLGTVTDSDLIIELKEGKVARNLNLKEKEKRAPIC